MFAQAIYASIESSLNLALRHDDSASQRIGSLVGKVVHLQMSEIPLPLIIRFHQDQVQLHGSEWSEFDAKVSFSIFDAPLLMDAADATHAIQQGKVALQGDPILLQQASQVFMQLDIDWESLLAAQIGDVPAYLIAKRMRAAHDPMRFKKAQRRAGELLVDELEIAASRTDFERLKTDVQALEAKLARAENRLKNALN